MQPQALQPLLHREECVAVGASIALGLQQGAAM
jgi:hypothetical protein